MTARVGVKRHLQVGLRTYELDQHNLLPVFDMDAKVYRSNPVEAIQLLSVGGQSFDFMVHNHEYFSLYGSTMRIQGFNNCYVSDEADLT